MRLSAGVLCLAALVGCGSDGSDASDESGGKAGAGSTGQGGQGSGGQGSGGAASTGNGGSNPGGAGQSTGGSGSGGPQDDAPGFDGIDFAALELPAAPAGCDAAPSGDPSTLTLTLSAEVPVLVLSVASQRVVANGVECSSAAVDAALRIVVVGSDGDDAVYLDTSLSTLYAGGGSVNAELGAGNDLLAALGTDAADTVTVGSDGDTLIIDMTGDNTSDVRSSAVERALVTTGPSADLVRGDGVALGSGPAAVALAIYGGGANDTLSGGAAADLLYGGIGDDTFDLGAAPHTGDVLEGGSGIDVADFSKRVADLAVTLGGGADDGEADEAVDVQASVEGVRGGSGSNTLTGSSADNHLWGGSAADIIQGGDGTDMIYGGGGNDVLAGQLGDDYLYGEDGDDRLNGDSGDDLLDGFTGANVLDAGTGDGDICVFSRTGDSVKGCEL